MTVDGLHVNIKMHTCVITKDKPSHRDQHSHEKCSEGQDGIVSRRPNRSSKLVLAYDFSILVIDGIVSSRTVDCVVVHLTGFLVEEMHVEYGV